MFLSIIQSSPKRRRYSTPKPPFYMHCHHDSPTSLELTNLRFPHTSYHPLRRNSNSEQLIHISLAFILFRNLTDNHTL